jgi:hypothetical protein
LRGILLIRKNILASISKLPKNIKKILPHGNEGGLDHLPHFLLQERSGHMQNGEDGTPKDKTGLMRIDSHKE